MSKIGFQELAIIFGVALLIFGPTKLPELGKAMGNTLREFRDATKEVSETIKDIDTEI